MVISAYLKRARAACYCIRFSKNLRHNGGYVCELPGAAACRFESLLQQHLSTGEAFIHKNRPTQIEKKSNSQVFCTPASMLGIGEELGRKAGLKEAQRIGEAIGIEKRNKEIARQLKQQGIAIEIIEKSTGLSKEEIERM